MREERKRFFFEKKKQKTFASAVATLIEKKFFGSFSQKRTAFFLLLSTAAHAQGIDLSHGGPVNVTATGGIDWDQAAQTVTARQDAQAVRGTVTVTADSLVAHYRKKAPAPGAAPVAPKSATPGPPDDTGSNEIYRLEALDHVHIFTPTDQAWGDHGVYDIDRAVLVLTGHALKLITPSDTLTARDTMEYWSTLHMAVGRGDAVVVTNDGRRVQADVLVGYTDPGTGNPTPKPGTTPGATPVADKTVAPPPAKPAPAKPGADPIASSGKLKRVDAFGHVQVRTPTEIVTGDRGVYIPDTGIARVVGHVHITRGENQLNGQAAIVDMHTGLATLSEVPGARVQGLVVPNQSDNPQAGPAKPAGAKPATQKGTTP